MTKLLPFLGALFLVINISCAQAPLDRPHLQDPKFDARVTQLLDFSVPVMSVGELAKSQSEVLVFDTRKKEEYEVSHIKDARYLGYKDFDVSRLKGIPKNTKIVLYCSIGYRSEKIGKKLKKLGYTQVYNLFGSIFEWMNQGYTVVDNEGQPTKKVHTYNKKWSKWVDENKVEKVW